MCEDAISTNDQPEKLPSGQSRSSSSPSTSSQRSRKSKGSKRKSGHLVKIAKTRGEANSTATVTTIYKARKSSHKLSNDSWKNDSVFDSIDAQEIYLQW